MAEDEQKRLERFGRLRPPSFSGAESDDAQGFLDSWWEANERRMSIGAVPLTWQEFSILFLEKFVSQSHKEKLRWQFEQLRQDDLSVKQYEMRFSKLARHVAWERVSGATFEEVVDIARQIETICSQERVEREAKRPRPSGGFGGVPSGGLSYHSRSRPYRHAQEGRPVHRGASSSHGSCGSHQGQSSLSALPAQSTPCAPSVQGSSVPGYSGSYSGSRDPPQNLPAFSERGCFECGNLGHIKRYCPRLTRGPVQQRSRVMTSAPAAPPPAQPARDGAQSARGRPRRGGRLGDGHAQFYDFPARPDVVASDAVITVRSME
ncbi:uncharacterized protein [Nicotiana tomentosiformis]|uniref:uncharacterized protein n=1 Tax=Nicotiana tomentosiformis TaxID=4098 RepID=UPI00388CA297